MTGPSEWVCEGRGQTDLLPRSLTYSKMLLIFYKGELNVHSKLDRNSLMHATPPPPPPPPNTSKLHNLHSYWHKMPKILMNGCVDWLSAELKHVPLFCIESTIRRHRVGLWGLEGIMTRGGELVSVLDNCCTGLGRVNSRVKFGSIN